MSETSVKQATTKVKGYFNPNPYRVNVSISELGIAVQLEPMEFILDRASGKKINDPVLDKYVGYRLLSAEASAQPVPVIAIPKVTAPAHSLHVVTQGARQQDGTWGAAPAKNEAPQSLVQSPPNVTRPSTVGMTIEEARRRGLIGKTRLVPEDYGAAETDGAPTRGDAIPPIKYAAESVAPNARSGNLPQELVEQVRPEAAPIVAQLQKAAAESPEAVDLSRQAAEKAVEAQQGKSGVQAFRKEVVQARAKPKVPTATMPPASKAQTATTPTISATRTPAKSKPSKRVARVVDAPVVATPVEEAAPEPLPVVPESPLVGGRPDALPEALVESTAETGAAAEAPAAPEPEASTEPAPVAEGQVAEKWVCGACNKEFNFRSYLIRHIGRAHKERMAELTPPE